MAEMTTADALAALGMSGEVVDDVLKINYMQKPHRFTPGAGGKCLFCANSQSWHSKNPPKSPDEVEAEAREKQRATKFEEAEQRGLMLTKIPSEDEYLAAHMAADKKEALAAKIGGVTDPKATVAARDPKAAALAKALLSLGLPVPAEFTDLPDTSATPSTPDADVAKAVPGEALDPEPEDDSHAAPRESAIDENERRFGMTIAERRTLADDGVAMQDGTFPIRSEADLKAALKFWGEADDPVAAREHIYVRAEDLDLLDLVPKAWGKTPEEQDALVKGLARRFKGRSAKTRPAAPDAGDPNPSLSVTAAGVSTGDAEDVAKRYTLGPLYMPNDSGDPTALDAHGEFVTSETLQKAVWDMTRAGDRRIFLQHHMGVVAGERVEMMVWPHEVTTDLVLPNGDGTETVHKATLPANTAYLGVIWEPWAYELVRKGKLRGYSMGGKARRVEVDLGEDAYQVAKAALGVAAADAIAKFNQNHGANGRFSSSKGGGSGSGTAHADGDDKEGDRGAAAGGASASAKSPKAKIAPMSERLKQPKGTVTHVPYPKHLEAEKDQSFHEYLQANGGLKGAARQVSRDLAELVRLVGGFATGGGAGVAKSAEIDGLTEVLKHPGHPDQKVHAGKRGGAGEGRLGRDMTDVEFQAHRDALKGAIASHAAGAPGNDPMQSKNATNIKYRRKGGKDGQYTPERTRQQKAIINAIIKDAVDRGVPTEGKGWIAVGASGAGKSTFLAKKGALLGLSKETDHEDGFARMKNAVVVNADDIKTMMIARGMVKPGRGILPAEMTAFIHEESSHVSERLAKAALKRKMNVVYDITGHSPESIADRLHRMNKAGYKHTTVFALDVPLTSRKTKIDRKTGKEVQEPSSLFNARERHRSGLNAYHRGENSIGGRYVPDEIVLGQAAPAGSSYSTRNRAAFETLRSGQAQRKKYKNGRGGERVGLPSRTVLVDNHDYAGRIVDDIDHTAGRPTVG